MQNRFNFDSDVLHSVAGGRSAIDLPRLNIATLESAQAFISNYGYDPSREGDIAKLWYFHRRALVLLTEKLGYLESEIPEVLLDRKRMGDISYLLIYASSLRPEDKDLQRWSCAILRCMHVYIHSESDLFASFTQEIQQQILTPFQQAIVHDGSIHKLKPHKSNRAAVELAGFEVKPFKASNSTVIKLLAKPDALAMKVFDKLGVRFITNSLFDSFQVIRFLVEENIISYPHIMPDQSSNNLFPVDLFIDICQMAESKNSEASNDEMSKIFDLALEKSGDDAKMIRKINEQSGQDFKFIKFITRKLIQIQNPGRENFSFFYPFEVQIMDQNAHAKILSGPSEHDAYKERQREAARRRVFPQDPGV